MHEIALSMKDLVQKLGPKLRLKLYLVFITASLALLSYSVYELRPVTVELTDFLGLISHLPLSYWIGLSSILLCSILAYIDRDFVEATSLFLLILVILFMFLIGISYLVEINPFYHAYQYSGGLKRVLTTYHVDSLPPTILSYRFHPVYHLISAFLLHVGGFDVSMLICGLDLLFYIIPLILIPFIIGKRLGLRPNQAFLLPLALLGSFWYRELYYGPLFFGYVAYLYLFMFFTAPKKTDLKGASLLFYPLIVMSHLYTSAVFLMSLFVLSISEKRINKVIVPFLFFLFWNILYQASPYAGENAVMLMINELTSILTGSAYSALMRKSLGGVGMRQVVNYFRLSYVGLYGVYMPLAFVLYVKMRERGVRMKARRCIYWVIGIMSVLPLTYYGAEVLERLYLYALVPMICILALTFTSKQKYKKYLMILIILFVMFHVPARYGSEAVEMVHTTELRGNRFFSFYGDFQRSYVYEMIPAQIGYYNDRWIEAIQLRVPPTFGSLSQTELESRLAVLSNAYYIIDSEGTDRMLRYTSGFNWIRYWVRQEVLNLAYNNGFYMIYLMT